METKEKNSKILTLGNVLVFLGAAAVEMAAFAGINYVKKQLKAKKMAIDTINEAISMDHTTSEFLYESEYDDENKIVAYKFKKGKDELNDKIIDNILYDRPLSSTGISVINEDEYLILKSSFDNSENLYNYVERVWRTTMHLDIMCRLRRASNRF